MQPGTTSLDYWRLASWGAKMLDEELLEEKIFMQWVAI